MQADLACLKDAIEFMIEQLTAAKVSPLDQFAAIDAAQGMLPYIQEKLSKDVFLNTMWHFRLGPPEGRPWELF